MSLNRYAKQRDANEQPIVQALRSAGCDVFLQDTPFDLLVWQRRFKRWHVLEVKRPKGKLNLRQRQIVRQLGDGAVEVVRTPIEALQAVGIAVEGGE